MCCFRVCVLVSVCVILSTATAESVNVTQDETQSEFIIVSLDGKTVEQFTEILESFKAFIARLAVEYCDINKFQDYGIVNASTVEVNSVRTCPAEWPNAELCVNVNFSVPVNSSGSYELNARHLYEMWKTHSISQLRSLGLQDYEIPSGSTILILWLSVTGLLFLLFLVILVFVIKTKFVENYIRRMNFDRRRDINSSNRSWMAQPMEKQLVPPFFYPDPSLEKQKELPLQYAVTNMIKDDYGIENPGYDPDRDGNAQTKRQNQNSVSTVVDDFDSDDETIYPPSPLSRPALHRTEKGKEVGVSLDELETAL